MNCDLGSSVTSCRLGVTGAAAAGLSGIGEGKSNPLKNDSVLDAGLGLVWNLSVVEVVGSGGGDVVVGLGTCLGLPVSVRAAEPCLAGKDLNLLEDLGLSSSVSVAGAGRPLPLTRIRLLSPLCLALVLTPSSSLLSSCISLIAALASSVKLSSAKPPTSSVSSTSSASLAVASRAFRAGDAWERRKTLVLAVVVSPLDLLTTRCLMLFLPAGLLITLLSVSASSTSGLRVVGLLKLILTICSFDDLKPLGELTVLTSDLPLNGTLASSLSSLFRTVLMMFWSLLEIFSTGISSSTEGDFILTVCLVVASSIWLTAGFLLKFFLLAMLFLWSSCFLLFRISSWLASFRGFWRLFSLSS